MVVTVAYTLASAESASLSLSTAQFHNVSSCSGSGELVDAVTYIVKRGSGTLDLPITWSGDTGEHSKGRIFGTGSLSFSMGFWEVNGQPYPHRIDLFNAYANTCMAF
jgi:hypothetical protein